MQYPYSTQEAQMERKYTQGYVVNTAANGAPSLTGRMITESSIALPKAQA